MYLAPQEQGEHPHHRYVDRVANEVGPTPRRAYGIVPGRTCSATYCTIPSRGEVGDEHPFGDLDLDVGECHQHEWRPTSTRRRPAGGDGAARPVRMLPPDSSSPNKPRTFLANRPRDERRAEERGAPSAKRAAPPLLELPPTHHLQPSSTGSHFFCGWCVVMRDIGVTSGEARWYGELPTTTTAMTAKASASASAFGSRRALCLAVRRNRLLQPISYFAARAVCCRWPLELIDGGVGPPPPDAEAMEAEAIVAGASRDEYCVRNPRAARESN